jgi:hypothetical protein
MTIVHGYCDLAELKHPNRLGIQDSDSDSNVLLEGVIEAVSRRIDDECNRRFWQDSDEVTRYYTASHSGYIFTDDIASPSSDITILTDGKGDGTYSDTWTLSDYSLEPYNAEQDGVPYQKIESSNNGQFLFPAKVKRGVKITAKWGWPSGPPKPIIQATLLQSERLFKRFSTPLGSESMSALGRMTLSIPALDPDVELLISRYKKIVFG